MAEIEIRPMRLDDEEAVRKLVCEEYMVREPLQRNLEMEPVRDGNAWFDMVFPACLKEGLSVVAVDSVFGDVVGFRCVMSVYKDNPQHFNFSKSDPNTRSLALTYEAVFGLYKDLDIFTRYGVDKYVNMTGLCVAQKYGRQGIAVKMVAMALDLSRKQNFRVATVETSSRYSARVFEKLGFEKLVEHPYDTMVLDGESMKMTDDMKYHYCFSLYVKEL
ncbi:uncharacterized protein LOC135481049 [Liolophura sinensis]|uniref:uncharacterized protein LOC135481049 n=1 Tax=Liolophura sinensis TaxID=3198878 RepID=UPI00315984A2